MKKLFTLAAAVLASFSLWAVDYYAPTADELIILTDGTKLVDHAAVTNAANTFTITKDKYCADPEDVSKLTDKVACLDLKDGNGKKTLTMAIAGCDSITLYHDKNSKARHIKAVVTPKDGVAATLEGPESTTYTGFKLEANVSYEIVFTGLEGTNGGDINVYAVRLHKGVTCEDPEFTVSPTEGTGFVGDPINITISSKNNSKPVDYAVTVDGVAGVIGTDYTYSESTGLVQATPLKAGKFEITFSQATDGTYCAAEESATFEISAKNPCTSFDIDAPATAHIGEEVTIELKNFDAAPTTIVWYDGEMNEITAANGKTSYTFTPAAAGTYAFQVTAWNAYNTYNEDEAYNYTLVTVAVGTDATLSDLKVNGATIDGFAADKFEYNLGELGVYDALKVEATATDAPYASAAVVDNGEGKVTVTVTAEDKSTKEYVINYTRKAATELASIEASTTWDWTKAGGKTDEQKATGTMPSNAEEFNFADVLKSPDAEFNAAALAGIAQFANRDGYFQGNMVKFNTTVPGTVVVTYSNTGGKRPYRHIKVNETMSAEGSADQNQKATEAINVSAGDVVITFYIPDATKPQEGNNDKVGPSMGRIYKIVFTKSSTTAIDNTEAAVKAVKMVENGMLIIKKDGKTYNVLGQTVR